jgi:glycosyltransferase involved in cell wall biosynthesis
VPRFGYVAGSALAVARARKLGIPAQALGLAYDVAGRLAGGRNRIVVGQGIGNEGGVVTSLVEPDEVRDVTSAPWPAIPWRLRLAWAGRLAYGKGLETLFEALAILGGRQEAGNRVELVILGDGPARGPLEALATHLGIVDRIHWLGYVADRPTYMDALASCDVFVFPSRAEGFPKVILEAMAAGLPVVASRAGMLAELAETRVIAGLAAPRAREVAAAVGLLAASPGESTRLRRAGHAFVTAHTRPVEAARLGARLQGFVRG